MSLKKYHLQNQDGKIIVPQLRLANTFFTRFKGLIGTKALSEDEGLLITPCKQVHTHFMGYAIDIVFLDHQDKVIEILSNVKPWKFTKYYRSNAVLELKAETAYNKIILGDRLQLSVMK